MTGLVAMVDWHRALLYAALAFVPLGLLLHAASVAGGWVGDRAGAAVARRIVARRTRSYAIRANPGVTRPGFSTFTDRPAFLVPGGTVGSPTGTALPRLARSLRDGRPDGTCPTPHPAHAPREREPAPRPAPLAARRAAARTGGRDA